MFSFQLSPRYRFTLRCTVCTHAQSTSEQSLTKDYVCLTPNKASFLADIYTHWTQLVLRESHMSQCCFTMLED